MKQKKQYFIQLTIRFASKYKFMSTHSYGSQCPNCGEQMDMFSSNKPFEYLSSECYHCGFYCYPQTGYRTLEELNEARQDQELKKLTKLPRQSKIWG